MEPSPDEFRGFASVGEIAEWVQLEGDPAEPDTPRGNLFAALGVLESTHWRVVAAMPRDDYEAVVATLTYVLPPQGEEAGRETRFTPAQLSQAGLIGRFARVAGASS